MNNLKSSIKLLLKKLDSERDKNYLVTLNNKKKYILKISNAFETKKVIELQDYVLSSLNKRSSINKIIPKKIHNKIKSYTDQNNSKCYVRILSFIEGKVFANSKNSIELEISLGTYIGLLSKELKNLGDELSDVLFVLICLANQTGIDLEKSFYQNLNNKTRRDNKRHLSNKKLKS